MTEVTKIKYRRRKSNIVWHFRKDCPQYPVEDFVEEHLKKPLKFQMICVVCKRIGAIAKDKAEDWLVYI